MEIILFMLAMEIFNFLDVVIPYKNVALCQFWISALYSVTVLMFILFAEIESKVICCGVD